jgi:hypothetical protein
MRDPRLRLSPNLWRTLNSRCAAQWHAPRLAFCPANKSFGPRRGLMIWARTKGRISFERLFDLLPPNSRHQGNRVFKTGNRGTARSATGCRIVSVTVGARQEACAIDLVAGAVNDETPNNVNLSMSNPTWSAAADIGQICNAPIQVRLTISGETRLFYPPPPRRPS